VVPTASALTLQCFRVTYQPCLFATSTLESMLFSSKKASEFGFEETEVLGTKVVVPKWDDGLLPIWTMRHHKEDLMEE